MPKCAYRNCTSTSKSKKSIGIRYRPFPKPKTNLTKCLLWLEYCGNEKLRLDNISKHTYICEKHFIADETNPTPFYESAGEDCRNSEIGRMIELGDNSNEDEYMEVLSSLKNDQHEHEDKNEHSYSKTFDVSTAHRHKETQTVPRSLCENSNQNQFSFLSLSENKHFKYFTGLTVQHFEALYTFLDPSIMPTLKYTSRNSIPIKTNALRKLTDKDKLCLTLMRLKRGYTLKELSIFYNLSVRHVSIIFRTWIQFIYLQSRYLRNTIFQGSRNMKKKDMPACFQAFKKKITSVIDVTEIRTQMSRNFQQENTITKYRHYHSIKFLVGISPAGAIIYNSEGYEGSISDTQLFKTSDIHYFLEEGDVLMVDRGFKIQDICDKKKCKLLKPPFLPGGLSLTVEEEMLMKQIANARILVQRAIQRIKTYKILAKAIRMCLLPLISNIFSVICFLVNFEIPLVM